MWYNFHVLSFENTLHEWESICLNSNRYLNYSVDSRINLLVSANILLSGVVNLFILIKAITSVAFFRINI